MVNDTHTHTPSVHLLLKFWNFNFFPTSEHLVTKQCEAFVCFRNRQNKCSFLFLSCDVFPAVLCAWWNRQEKNVSHCRNNTVHIFWQKRKNTQNDALDNYVSNDIRCNTWLWLLCVSFWWESILCTANERPTNKHTHSTW